MAPRKEEQYHFAGFENPTTTPVPDVIFDELLSVLREAELKALLYICRRTFGFKKDRDPISFNQFLRGITTREGKVLDHGCGIRDRTTLSRALKALVELGVVVAEKGIDERGENMTTIYRLRFKSDTLPASTGSQPTIPSPGDHHRGTVERVVGNSYHRSRDRRPPVVGDSYPQETVLQETEEQEIDLSNIRKINTSENEVGPDSPKGPGAPRAPSPHAQTPQDGRRKDFVRAGDVLAGRQQNDGPLPATTPQKAYPEERQRILSSIQDFARELGDEAPLASSVSRAYNLWEQSGIPIEAFSSFLYEARSRTWEATANITKQQQAGNDSGREIYGPSKNRMAYYFSVLEELVGRYAPGKGAHPSPANSSDSQPVISASSPLQPTDPRAAIERYIETTAKAFGDEAPLKSSVTRALHLYERSGVPLARFLAYLFETKSLTEEYSANITKRRQGREGPFGPEQNRMAYFFSILESRLRTSEASPRLAD